MDDQCEFNGNKINRDNKQMLRADCGDHRNMSDSANLPSLLGEALLDSIRQAVREEIQAAASGNGAAELLTPEELAAKLKIPLSWVYEQSRQGNIPTHRLGRYIRFDLQEVLISQKKS